MIVVYDHSFKVLALSCTVITIVNYDPKSFIVQATVKSCRYFISPMLSLCVYYSLYDTNYK
jgi:hypothetical protein